MLTRDRAAVATSTWGTTDVVAGLVLLASLQAGQTILAYTGHVPRTSWLTFGFLYFPTVLTALAVLALASWRGARLRELGFVRPRSWRPALYAWAGAIAAGPAYAAALALLGSDALGGLLVADLAAGDLLTPTVLTVVIAMVVVAPIVEEVIFRGLLFRGLRARIPLLPALVITGVVFAAFHLSLAQLIPLALVGLLFAYAYERTGSLWCSVAPHAGLNAMVCLVLFVR